MTIVEGSQAQHKTCAGTPILYNSERMILNFDKAYLCSRLRHSNQLKKSGGNAFEVLDKGYIDWY